MLRSHTSLLRGNAHKAEHCSDPNGIAVGGDGTHIHDLPNLVPILPTPQLLTTYQKEFFEKQAPIERRDMIRPKGESISWGTPSQFQTASLALTG